MKKNHKNDFCWREEQFWASTEKKLPGSPQRFQTEASQTHPGTATWVPSESASLGTLSQGVTTWDSPQIEDLSWRSFEFRKVPGQRPASGQAWSLGLSAICLCCRWCWFATVMSSALVEGSSITTASVEGDVQLMAPFFRGRMWSPSSHMSAEVSTMPTSLSNPALRLRQRQESKLNRKIQRNSVWYRPRF